MLKKKDIRKATSCKIQQQRTDAGPTNKPSFSSWLAIVTELQLIGIYAHNLQWRAIKSYKWKIIKKRKLLLPYLVKNKSCNTKHKILFQLDVAR